MTDLKQLQTTSYSQAKGKCSSGKPPEAEHVCFNREQEGKQYGWVKIISAERRYTKGWSGVYVHTECQGCGRKQWQYLANLTTGRSKGCQRCSQPRRIPHWLDRRITSQKQRCQNVKDANYENYGARGIEFKFDSVVEAGLWVVETLGLPEREMELDRIDNNGHYEKGNIRWATRGQQQINRRNDRQKPFHRFRQLFPHVRYADNTLRNLIGKGLTFAEIEDRFYRPSCKPKGVYGTFSTADPEIASQYQGS